MSRFVFESSSIMSDNNTSQIARLGLPLLKIVPAAKHPELTIR